MEGTTQVLPATVTYSNTYTPALTASTGISPRFGSVEGGTTVTFSGSNFGNTVGDVTVTIDGIDCAVQTVTNT